MALVVEDGTGLANADSYASVADCDTYLTARAGASNAFTVSSTVEKEAALRIATDDFNNLYGSSLAGARINATMSLLLPRTGITDPDGFAIESDAVPLCAVYATCELALRVRETTTGTASARLYPDNSDASETSRKRIRAGSVEVEKYFESGSESGDRYPRITSMLYHILEAGSRVRLA